MATGKAIIYKGIPYFSDVAVPTRVSQLANDAGYLTTDEKVKQTPNTTSLYSHPILFSASDDNGEVVGGTYKNPDFYYNPSLNRMIFKNGGGIEVRSGTTNVSILSYIHLSDLTDACSIMNVTTNDIELDDVTYQGTTYSNTWDGTHHSLKSSISSLKQSLVDYFTKSYTITASSERAFIKDLATQAYSYMISKSLPFMLVNATWDGNNAGYMIISSTRRFQVQIGSSMSLGILNAAGTDIAQLRSVTSTAHP